MYSSKGSFFLISLLISSTVFSSILLSVWTKPALGDGLTQEQLTASLGNRKADLLIKMIPPAVTTETLQNGQKPVVEFRLFDSNTNKSFSHVTYYIIIEKDGKRLLADLFHDHNGDLRIQINPSNSSQVSISGQQDPLLGAYIATPDSPIIASGPIFIKGGLYHLIVRIATVDSDSTLLPDNQEPIYDSWLSIGIAVDQQINVNGKQIPIKVISYYDKINNFNFQPSNKLFTWSMSFNWNLTRIKQQPIFVHEEIRLPKSWKGFGDSARFNATVNGQPLLASLISIDPFSVPNEMVVHYLINKNDIIKLAQEINSNNKTNTGLMNFTLSPVSATTSMSSMSGSNSSMSPAGTNATSVSIVKGASNPSTQKPYNPSPVNVAVGRTVLWINNDNTAHTVTEGNPSGNTPSNGFDSGIRGPGQTFKHAFDKPGTVGYFCRLHPFMLGEVIAK